MQRRPSFENTSDAPENKSDDNNGQGRRSAAALRSGGPWRGSKDAAQGRAGPVVPGVVDLMPQPGMVSGSGPREDEASTYLGSIRLQTPDDPDYRGWLFALCIVRRRCIECGRLKLSPFSDYSEISV